MLPEKWSLCNVKLKWNRMLRGNLLIMFRNWLQCVVVPAEVNSSFVNLIKWAKKKKVFTTGVFTVLKMVDQDIDSDIEIQPNVTGIDLDDTADTNNIVPESLITKVKKGDRDKRWYEDIDDNSCWW